VPLLAPNPGDATVCLEYLRTGMVGRVAQCRSDYVLHPVTQMLRSNYSSAVGQRDNNPYSK